MSFRPSSNELEVFQEDLEENMKFLSSHLDHVNILYVAQARQLCEDHDNLSINQLQLAMKLWRQAHDNSGE